MQAHEIVSEVLKKVSSQAKVGTTTKQLDKIAYDFILKQKAQPYNLGYKPTWSLTPFPASLCTSVNDQICHGVPSDYKLQSGDLINFDIGVFKDGTCGDAALSIGVGTVSNEDKELLEVAMGTLFAGIKEIRPGVFAKDVGSKMNGYAEDHGYVTNRKLCGHGIGLDMHMKPDMPNYYDHNNHAILEEGMIICLEPQVTKKDREGRIVGDWDYRTRKGKKSAFFEHMIKVTKDGYEILTTHIPHHY